MESQPNSGLSTEDRSRLPWLRAQTVIGAGRGALVEAMFAADWLGWGLGNAKAFNGFVGPKFGFAALSLFGGSIYVIRTGRLLRKSYPEVGRCCARIHW